MGHCHSTHICLRWDAPLRVPRALACVRSPRDEKRSSPLVSASSRPTGWSDDAASSAPHGAGSAVARSGRPHGSPTTSAAAERGAGSSSGRRASRRGEGESERASERARRERESERAGEREVERAMVSMRRRERPQHATARACGDDARAGRRRALDRDRYQHLATTARDVPRGGSARFPPLRYRVDSDRLVVGQQQRRRHERVAAVDAHHRAPGAAAAAAVARRGRLGTVVGPVVVIVVVGVVVAPLELGARRLLDASVDRDAPLADHPRRVGARAVTEVGEQLRRGRRVTSSEVAAP